MSKKLILFFLINIFIGNLYAAEEIKLKSTKTPEPAEEVDGPAKIVEPVDHYSSIGKTPIWTQVKETPLSFPTAHTQGLVKKGDFFFLSAVETFSSPRRLTVLTEKLRSLDSRGKGHFYKFDTSGNLIKEVVLGTEVLFHPGGIDDDGTSIWVPVAKYKPHSQSIIYKINPETLEATEAFRVEDHIGAIAYNRDADTVIGANWDGEEFYEWKRDGTLIRKLKNPGGIEKIEYQDCKYAGQNTMLCGGKKNSNRGALNLLDLKDFKIIRNIFGAPTVGKVVLTRNPIAFDIQDKQMYFYFVPEDMTSRLFTYTIQ